MSTPPPTKIIVPLTGIYASLQSHKLHFIIYILNLIWVLVLYVPRASSFISTQYLELRIRELKWQDVLI